MVESVFELQKLANQKGMAAEKTVRISGRAFVKLFDATGREIDGAKRMTGFSLIEAQRILEVLPDRAPAAKSSQVKNSRRLGQPTRQSNLLLPIVGGK
jgi:hypothetical protein